MKNESVRPFAEQGNYISMHRILFDAVMPCVSPNAWKVLCLIVRKTIGWQKDLDVITYPEIKRGTGIASDATVRAALAELQGLVPLKRHGDYVRAPDKPQLVVAYPGARRPDGKLDPTGYSLNADVEVHPLQKVKQVEPTSIIEGNNKQSLLSNSEMDNVTGSTSSNSEMDNYRDPFDFDDGLFDA